jgi:hypothetical protein
MKTAPTPPHANRKHGVVRPHPRPAFRDKIELYQFRRGADNPTWDARFKISDVWSGWVSLGTAEWDDAIFVAIDRLNEREHAAKFGTPLPGRGGTERNTVAEIATVTLARLRAKQTRILATKESKKAHVFTAKISAIENKLLPALGPRGIASLSEDDMERFRLGVTVGGRKATVTPPSRQAGQTAIGSWAAERACARSALIEQQPTPVTRKPKRSTIANTNSAWLEILNDAVEAGHISRARKRFLVISQSKFEKGERGSGFSRSEMEQLRAHMSSGWIKAAHTATSRENRFLLRCLVSLVATTGIRPGLEVELLTPAQVVRTKDHYGVWSIRSEIRAHQGKFATGRIAWARVNDVWPVVDDLLRLQAWIADHATDAYRAHNPAGYIFCRPSDGEFPIFHRIFEEVLETLGIRIDPVTKVNRRLYSLRHYYATQALMDGVDVAFVAKNMGTSERMIHEHYEHIITDLRSGLLTGSRNPIMAQTDRQIAVTQYALRRIEHDPDDHLTAGVDW